ncbi:MAG: type II toxin-antitoxin system RelE family toxin [Lachnospirales bacterium]
MALKIKWYSQDEIEKELGYNMYRVQYSEKALKQLKEMDKQIAKLIIAYVRKNLEGYSNPRLYGKGL